MGATDGTAAQIEVAAGAKGTGDGKRTDDAGIRMSSSQLAGFHCGDAPIIYRRNCAEQVFEHVRRGKFYVLLDNNWDGRAAGLTDDLIRLRLRAMTNRSQPHGGAVVRRPGSALRKARL